MTIDMYAHEVQFVDHLAAVWHALPTEARGRFHVYRPMEERARARGITPTTNVAPDPSRPVLVASYGDTKRMRRDGYTRIAYIEHGAGQSYPGDRKGATHSSYAGGRDRGDVGLFLMPNEYSAAMWRAAYPRARVDVVGCPKLDLLPAREPGPGPVVAVTFHWDCRLVQETRTAYYAFRAALPDLAARWAVIGHAHPRALDGPPDLRREYRRLGIELVEDFEDVCRRADLLVFDNTSAGFEFAATGRPVVVLNDPVGRTVGRGYRPNVSHGLRFWDAAGVGINVGHAADLEAAVERALGDPPQVAAERERALELVYAHRDGAARRAAEVLLDWAAIEIEEAA
jgi:hypothetical protein